MHCVAVNVALRLHIAKGAEHELKAFRSANKHCMDVDGYAWPVQERSLSWHACKQSTLCCGSCLCTASASPSAAYGEACDLTTPYQKPRKGALCLSFGNKPPA